MATCFALATTGDDAEPTRLERSRPAVARGRAARASELGLPLAFVDVEVTLDGTAILHALPWDACDATALLDELAARFGLAVRLLDLVPRRRPRRIPARVRQARLRVRIGRRLFDVRHRRRLFDRLVLARDR